MSAFEFQALDAKGRNKRGVLEGDTPRQVRQQLRAQGLTPISVAAIAEHESRGGTGRQGGARLTASELAVITRQLATLLRAGIPLAQALGEVASQSHKVRVERILIAVRARVREGHSLAGGLSEFPRVFSDLYRKTVAAGEQAGHIDLVLERLADYTERAHALRQRTRLALFYPSILTVMAILVVSGLLAYVVPQVVQVFEDTGQTLPWITRALIAMSDATRIYGLYVVLALVLIFIAVRAALKRRRARLAWDRWMLRIPLVGGLLRGVNAARFARTLSILTASSVPILEALQVSAQVLSNHCMREAVVDATARVREGASIRSALEKTGYFPPMTLSLIASGETSGELQDMLERAAEVQERETETRIATLLGLFEPILILVMGAVVLLIVLAILLPIFELNQLVG